MYAIFYAQPEQSSLPYPPEQSNISSAWRRHALVEEPSGYRVLEICLEALPLFGGLLIKPHEGPKFVS